jgi:hypothetical protein
MIFMYMKVRMRIEWTRTWLGDGAMDFSHRGILNDF